MEVNILRLRINRNWRNHYSKKPEKLQVSNIEDLEILIIFLIGDIILFDNMLVLYKPVVDVFIYILGGLEENEIMLQSVLLGFVEAISTGLKYIGLYYRKLISFPNRGQLERRLIMENLDLILLTLDETIYDGYERP